MFVVKLKSLKGQKLSKFVPIRWQIDPMIQMITQNWNWDLKNAQFWQKMDFLYKEIQKKNCPIHHLLVITYSVIYFSM